MTTQDNTDSLGGVRPLNFANVLDWFERASSNPLGSPFFSDDTPELLTESFADAFGVELLTDDLSVLVQIPKVRELAELVIYFDASRTRPLAHEKAEQVDVWRCALEATEATS